MIIESRLGKQEIDEEKIIHFPSGIIGFEFLRNFTILQIREESPFLVLQSIEDASIGLLVTDPFSFIKEYTIEINDADQAKLGAESHEDIAVLVTVSIPQGKPEETVLNLAGPIIINHKKKLALQSPQHNAEQVGKVHIHTHTIE